MFTLETNCPADVVPSCREDADGLLLCTLLELKRRPLLPRLLLRKPHTRRGRTEILPRRPTSTSAPVKIWARRQTQAPVIQHVPLYCNYGGSSLHEVQQQCHIQWKNCHMLLLNLKESLRSF
ncbi:uncharacterized protein LOC119170885 isoform X2 [Rhipicephalus microplus]|uniref:uncharacterized protein LOC119170885 isoform X2 n=1 Tax=Rhipicephalus microplus TaxID=6941 RepID=UPI003F6D44E5